MTDYPELNLETIIGSVRDLKKLEQVFSTYKPDVVYHAFRPGRASLPMATPMGPVGALVCYDLRFPEISRELAFAGCRLFIVAAEWSLLWLAHWRALTQARAIENQCYVVACNACGQTGGLIMAGHSRILGPGGEVLAEAGEEPGLMVAPLNY